MRLKHDRSEVVPLPLKMRVSISRYNVLNLIVQLLCLKIVS